MEEKGTDFFEKYELTVTGSMRVRGAFRIDTETGPKLLLPYGGSEARAEFEQALLSTLREEGFFVDDYLRNKEGGLLTKDEYGDTYLLKNWYYGDECNLKRFDQVIEATRNLARLHNCMTDVKLPSINSENEKPENDQCSLLKSLCDKSLPELFEKRNRELRRVRSFLREKRRKTYFENLYINTFPVFFSKAEEVLSYAKSSESVPVLERCIREGRVCHGSYTHHNVLFLPDGAPAAVNFERACFGVPISDFYLFFRKLMEKSNWNLTYAEEVLLTYERIRTVEKKEWQILFLLLIYPEKFWKISNSYFNSKKSFFPQRTTEKLQTLLSQEREKQEVLEKVIKKYC